MDRDIIRNGLRIFRECFQECAAAADRRNSCGGFRNEIIRQKIERDTERFQPIQRRPRGVSEIRDEVWVREIEGLEDGWPIREIPHRIFCYFGIEIITGILSNMGNKVLGNGTCYLLASSLINKEAKNK